MGSAVERRSGGELTGNLRPLQFFTISWGAIVGVAWIPLLGPWLEQSGSLGAVLAFAFGGAIIMVVAQAYVRVATAVPVSGGEVAYTLALFGKRPAFLVGWILCFIYIATAAFEAISIGLIMSWLIPGIQGPVAYEIFGAEVRVGSLALGLAMTLLLGIVHMTSSRAATGFQDAATILQVLVTIVFVVAGLLFGDVRNLQPAIPIDDTGLRWAGIASVFAVTPLFYAGFNFAVQAIGERAPDVSVKSIGKALTLSFVAAGAFYILVIVVAAMALPREQLLASELPAAAAFHAAFGSPILGNLVLTAGLLGLLTTWNALILAAARILHRLAAAELIPFRLGHLHPTRGTPIAAIAFVTMLTAVGALGGSGALVPIVATAGLGITLAYTAVCLADLRLTRGSPQRAAWLAFACTVFVLFVALAEPFLSHPVVHMPLSWWIFAGWAVLGVVVGALAPGRSGNGGVEMHP